MTRIISGKIILILLGGILNVVFNCDAQFGKSTVWRKDGNAYFRFKNFNIIQVTLPDNQETIVAPRKKLLIDNKMVAPESFSVSGDNREFLIFLNSKKVWSYHTRGDYWLYKIQDSSFVQLGKTLPASSLMFAKLSPDGNQVAYVSGNNIYVEDVSGHHITQLTFDGGPKMMNGTFDWVYEQELDCRDGFRWSPNSKQIVFWQIDARNIMDYAMLNTTDSVYSRIINITTPVAGDAPSSCRIGVIDLKKRSTTWMKILTDTGLKSYIPRMEWCLDNNHIIVQHLNRRQNVSQLIICDVNKGTAKIILKESDTAWINVQSSWDDSYKMGGWDWIENGKAFIWASETDGWRHLYRISTEGKIIKLITPGPYDVMGIEKIDESAGYLYYLASPQNATQAYLYRTPLYEKGNPQLVSPANETGSHSYDISPNGHFALHDFSNYYILGIHEWITLPDHKEISGHITYNDSLAQINKSKSNIRYFKIKTGEGIEMDGWETRPRDFDSAKKYPVVFFVYTGPAQQTVIDRYGSTYNFLYDGDMSKDGYIYISVDNRGTPAPKGAAWRKSVFCRMGKLDIADQAAAAREIMKWNYVDSNRIAVWGWSNGGTATLNLMFQYPDIYKTGIAVAAISNYLYYDNIWMEHVMGLPRDNSEAYIAGSPITYARNLKGHLLFIHGTADDNVHFKHAELLLNELIKYGKSFQFMEYPNNDHNIDNSNATKTHLSSLYTHFLNQYCPPGPSR